MNRLINLFQGKKAEVLKTKHGEVLETILIREGRLEPSRASRLLIKLCDLVMHLQKINPEIILYRDVDLSDILIDEQEEVILIHREEPLKDEECNATQLELRRFPITLIQSLGLLYYHLLTGMHPRLSGFTIKPFSELGIYLPGEVFDIILKALKQDEDNVFTLSSFKTEIEKLFSAKAKQREYTKQAFKPQHPYERKGTALWVAGITFTLSMAIMICFYLFVIRDIMHESQDILNERHYNVHTAEPIESNAVPSTQNPEPSIKVEAPTQEVIISETTPPASEPTIEPTPKPIKQGRKIIESKQKVTTLNILKPMLIKSGNDKFTMVALNPQKDKDIYGGMFDSGIKFQLTDGYLSEFKEQWIEVEYELDSAYSRLLFTFSLSYASKAIDPGQKTWINVFGDGKLLVSSDPIGADSAPVKLDVPLKGVKRLKLQLNPASQFIENAEFLLGDAYLNP